MNEWMNEWIYIKHQRTLKGHFLQTLIYYMMMEKGHLLYSEMYTVICLLRTGDHDSKWSNGNQWKTTHFETRADVMNKWGFNEHVTYGFIITSKAFIVHLTSWQLHLTYAITARNTSYEWRCSICYLIFNHI